MRSRRASPPPSKGVRAGTRSTGGPAAGSATTPLSWDDLSWWALDLLHGIVTVAFEPAGVYEFVDRADPKRVYEAVVDEVIQAEIGTPPGRVVLTAGRTRTWTNAGSGTS